MKIQSKERESPITGASNVSSGGTREERLTLRILRWVRSRPTLLVLALVTASSALLYSRILRQGLPPGVDSATFLHFAWFVQKTLQGQGGLADPWWYGGFPLFRTYPPLAYSLPGVLAFLTHLDLIVVYKAVVLVACVGLGMATYWAALELRTGTIPATIAAVLVITGYPLITAASLWGWFSTIIALALGVASFAALERGLRLGSRRMAVLGGILLGLSVLAHHMTAFALAIVLLTWGTIRMFNHRRELRRFLFLTGAFAIATCLVALWWIVLFLFHAVEVGFEREIPGLWDFSIRRYLSSVFDARLMGAHIYPSYAGIIPVGLALGGGILSILRPNKATAYGATCLILLVFSLGQRVNPIIRIWPFNGLDVARFSLFLLPFSAVLGGSYLGELWQGFQGWTKRPLVAFSFAGLVLLAIMGFQIYDGFRASKSMPMPFKVETSVCEALDWLAEPGTVPGAVLAIGWWNWDSFLIPTEAARQVMDGWYDEGTTDWRPIREVRHMMWSGDVDVPRLHQLMGERNTTYVVVYDYYDGEQPQVFMKALRLHPELFREVATWDDIAIFQWLPGT